MMMKGGQKNKKREFYGTGLCPSGAANAVALPTNAEVTLF